MAKGYRGGAGRGMGGVNMNMVRQAQRMQQDMQKMQQELETREYVGKAGGGMITAVADGQHRLKSLTISPEIVDPEDAELLADAVMAAVNDALQQADEDASRSIGQVTGNLDLSRFGL